jgi:hypothetical protein
MYLHFYYQNECDEYAGLLLALGILNIIWIIMAFLGLKSINSKRSYMVQRNMYGIVFIFVSRIAFYVIMGIEMNNNVEASQVQLCNAIYQGGLILITAGIEGLALIILLYLTYRIKNYIQSKIRDLC